VALLPHHLEQLRAQRSAVEHPAAAITDRAGLGVHGVFGGVGKKPFGHVKTM
jgi:hypothetical protein